MADVFISYAHANAKQARSVAAALRASGFTVWMDDELAAHRVFTHAIEEQLAAAPSALVIWSAESARSEWVLSEANRAREDRKLVQLAIDRTRLPMPFDQLHCADFAGWTGDGEHPNWGRITSAIREVLGARRDPATTAAPAPAPLSAPAEPLLAVLAFDNLSNDPEMAYFSDGVSEEILQTVARGADLKVLGRASSFQFRGAEKAAAKVAAALKATHVLDGSVRRAGPMVRITANLIECAGETNMWSDRFDRDLSDIFAVQDEIATAVARALKAKLVRAPQPAPIDPDTYDLYLRVAYNSIYLTAGFASAFQQLRIFEEIVARAPEFARGWAGLAYTRSGILQLWPDQAAAAGITLDQAAEAAHCALRLDPRTGMAFQALVMIEPWANYAAREALSAQALAAAPSDAEVISHAGLWSHCGVGRLREGEALLRRAYELDPMSAGVATSLGIALVLGGQLDEACHVADRALARFPEQLSLAGNAMIFAALRGDRTRVETLIRAWSASGHSDPVLRYSIRWARNQIAPDADDIQGMLDDARTELDRTGTVSLTEAVTLYGLGLTDAAFALLEKASFPHLFERGGVMPSGRFFPGTMFTRSYGMYQDRRFPRLCAKLGLARYWTESGKWPDCAEAVPYDFRAEIRRAAESG